MKKGLRDDVLPLLPYEKDKGIGAFKYLLMAWVIRARRIIVARHSATTLSTNAANSGVLTEE